MKFDKRKKQLFFNNRHMDEECSRVLVARASVTDATPTPPESIAAEWWKQTFD